MPTAIPITEPGATGDAYLDAAGTRSLVAGLPTSVAGGLAALSDAELTALAYQASADVDNAMRYQGRKVDPTQVMEFPRVAYSSTPGVNQFGMPLAGPASLPLVADSVVWDWDETTQAAVVPAAVKLAVIHQMVWILTPGNAERWAAIRSGLASQGIGSGNESYAADAAQRVTGLAPRAEQVMRRYRLATGRLL
jgi:hypothetical protein